MSPMKDYTNLKEHFTFRIGNQSPSCWNSCIDTQSFNPLIWQADKQSSVTKVVKPFSENLVQVANFPINNELSFATKRGKKGRERQKERVRRRWTERERERYRD